MFPRLASVAPGWRRAVGFWLCDAPWGNRYAIVFLCSSSHVLATSSGFIGESLSTYEEPAYAGRPTAPAGKARNWSVHHEKRPPACVRNRTERHSRVGLWSTRSRAAGLPPPRRLKRSKSLGAVTDDAIAKDGRPASRRRFPASTAAERLQCLIGRRFPQACIQVSGRPENPARRVRAAMERWGFPETGYPQARG